MKPPVKRTPQPELTIVVPFLNEEEVLKHFYEEVSDVVDALQVETEFLFIDDGSVDDSVSVLRKLKQEDSRIRILVLSRNFGKEAALTCGLEHARGEAVIPMDADLQDPPALIGEMLEKWRKGYEVVNAQRVNRSTDSWAKRMTANGFYQIINWFSDVKLPVNVGDFRLLDRKVVEVLKSLPERRRFMKGLFAWVGFKTATVEYARPERPRGKTKFNGWRLWNFALEGITSFSSMPLRIWAYVGLGISLVAFSYGLFLLIRTLATGVDVPGYASLFLAIVFFGGLQLMSMGLLGEYIGRIFTETKQRPIYVVREEI